MSVVIDGTAGITTPAIASTTTSAGALSAASESFAAPPAVTTPQSMVRVGLPNSYGSTNTRILRYSTVNINQGSDITYADSATLGGTFTINVSGVYSMSLQAVGPAGMHVGISRNTSQPTVDILALTNNYECIAGGNLPAANYQAVYATTMQLAAGDIIRVHTDAQTLGVTNYNNFTITRIA